MPPARTVSCDRLLHSTDSSMQEIQIGKLAQLLSTSTKTLRFYERMRLLDPPGRTQSSYRVYDDAAVQRARLVVDLRRLGLSILELHELLNPDNAQRLRKRLLGLMDEKLQQMYLQLSVLQGRSDDLSARHAALLATPRTRSPTCICDALFRPCTCAK